MKIISPKQALNSMLILLTSVILFHVLVLLQIIPYTIVWAGKLENVSEMQSFETVSILINIFLIFVMLFKANYIHNKIPSKFLNGIIWLFVVAFSVNTIGNLFAKSKLEIYIGTSLTFISTILCWRIVCDSQKITNKPTTPTIAD